jgi:hypothetical protein
VHEYSDALADEWDGIVERSVNGTFLQSRRFLAYHRDRFVDRSAVVRDGSGTIVGCVPAAEHPTLPGVVDSHPGATFGGLVHDGRLWGEDTRQALSAVALHFRALGYHELRYKPTPYLYQLFPTQDDVYALFRLGATRYRCDLTSCFALGDRGMVKHGRRDSIRKATRANVEVVTDWGFASPFWAVLEGALVHHDAVPTHQLEEVEYLHAQLPHAIHLHTAHAAGELLAGALVFDLGRVRHTQYLANSPEGRRIGALDAVIEAVIRSAHGSPDLRYFDFGTSNREEGMVLNDSLYGYKRSFGAGSAVHEHLSLPLDERLHYPLDGPPT